MEPAGSAGGASLPSSTDRAVSAQGATSGRVWFGTCGWTDDSILRCGRFYPAGVKTAEQRLEVYGRHFPCVEVDSSTYAIPRPNATASWAARVPKGFRFHFKAFGLFCNRSCPFSALPWEAKQRLRGPDGASGAGVAETVSLEELGAEVEAVVWEVFHACLEPVIKAQRMGAVVFQFQLGVKPGPEARRHVEHCRRMLSPRLPMAVEFRNRAWFADAASAADTAAWLASLQPAGGVSLVAADELRHETYVNSRTAAGGAVRPEILPIAMEVCDPRYLYVRLHRREGTRERLLGQDEAQAWSARLEAVAPKLSGPVYFLIGTDWEDAPITNARLLEAALPPQLRYGWKAALAAAAAARPSSIHAMLAKGGKGGGGRSAAAAEAGGSGSACTSSAPPAGEPAGPGRADGAPPSEAAAESAPSGQAAAGDPGEPSNILVRTQPVDLTAEGLEASTSKMRRLLNGSAGGFVLDPLITAPVRLFLVKFTPGSEDSLRDQLTQGGATILEYIPDDTLLVYGRPSIVVTAATQLLGSRMAEYRGRVKVAPEASRLVLATTPLAGRRRRRSLVAETTESGNDAEPQELDELALSAVLDNVMTWRQASKIISRRSRALLQAPDEGNVTGPDQYGVSVQLVGSLSLSEVQAIFRDWPGQLAAALGLSSADDPCWPQLSNAAPNETSGGTAYYMNAFVCPEDIPDAVAWLLGREVAAWVAPMTRAESTDAVGGWITQSGGISLATNKDPSAKTRPYWAAGVMGNGEIVGVDDTGVDLGSCYFMDDDYPPKALAALQSTNGPPVPRHWRVPDHRKVVQYISPFNPMPATLSQPPADYAALCCAIPLTPANNYNMSNYGEGSGHGTHVVGIVTGAIGDGSANFRHDNGTGAAPMARVSLVDCEDPTTRFNVPGQEDWSVLPNQYNAGARIGSDSWGLTGAGGDVYDENSLAFDAFAWRHPDFLSVIAAGNEGRNGKMPWGTVSAPSTAKNVIAVAALANHADGVNDNGDHVMIVFRYKCRTSALSPYPRDYSQTAVWPVLGSGDYTFAKFVNETKKGAIPVVRANPLGACSSLVGSYGSSFVLVNLGAPGPNCSLATRAANLVAAGVKRALFMRGDGEYSTPDKNWPSYAHTSLLSAPITRGLGQFMINVLNNTLCGLRELAYMGPDNITIGPSSVADFPSYGPTRDGRIKPDLAAPGQALQSAKSTSFNESAGCSDALTWKSGTSMATPTVSGHLALVRQYLRHGYYPAGWVGPQAANFTPSGMLLKALAIAGARSLQGWGRMDLSGTIPLPGLSPEGHRLQVADMGTIVENQTITLYGIRATGEGPITAVLVWHDYPAALQATKALVNNLDLGYALNGSPNITFQQKELRFLFPITFAPDATNNVERTLLTNLTAGTDVAFAVFARRLGSRLVNTADAQLPQRWALAVVGHFTGTLRTRLNPAYMQPQRLPAFLEPRGPYRTHVTHALRVGDMCLASGGADGGPLLSARNCLAAPPPPAYTFRFIEEGGPRTRLRQGSMWMGFAYRPACVGLPSNNDTLGVKPALQLCSETLPKQYWGLEPAVTDRPGVYSIRSDRGLCWELDAGSRLAPLINPLLLGPRIRLALCDESDAQRFLLTEYTQGFRTISPATGLFAPRCVDATAGDELTLPACNISRHGQRFELYDTPAPGTPSARGYAYRIADARGSCLTLNGTASGANTLWSRCAAGLDSQRFLVFENSHPVQSSVFYQLVPRPVYDRLLGLAPRMCLAVNGTAGGVLVEGSRLFISPCNVDDPRQRIGVYPVAPVLRITASWQIQPGSGATEEDPGVNLDLVVSWSLPGALVPVGSSNTFSLHPLHPYARGGRHGGDNRLAKPLPTQFEYVAWAFDDVAMDPPDGAIYRVCITPRSPLANVTLNVTASFRVARNGGLAGSGSRSGILFRNFSGMLCDERHPGYVGPYNYVPPSPPPSPPPPPSPRPPAPPAPPPPPPPMLVFRTDFTRGNANDPLNTPLLATTADNSALAGTDGSTTEATLDQTAKAEAGGGSGGASSSSGEGGSGGGGSVTVIAVCAAVGAVVVAAVAAVAAAAYVRRASARRCAVTPAPAPAAAGSAERAVQDADIPDPGPSSEPVSRLYLLRLTASTTASLRTQLEAGGASILDYIPQDILLVYGDPGVVLRVARRLGIKADPGGSGSGPDLYGVSVQIPITLSLDQRRSLVRRWAAQLSAALGRTGSDQCRPSVVAGGEGVVKAFLCKQDLDAGIAWLSDQEESTWVAPVYTASTMNAVGGWITQTGDLSAEREVQLRAVNSLWRPYWAAGLLGNREIVGMADTGLDLGHCFFLDPRYPPRELEGALTGDPPRWVRPDHRKVVSYIAPSEDSGMSQYGDRPAGHGTHTSGTVAGVMSPGDAGNIRNTPATGSAPMARLAMYDLEDGDGNFNAPLASDGELLPSLYAAGARITSESWGWLGIGAMEYSDSSRSYDRFSWRNPDMVSVLAAGNYGQNGNLRSTVTGPSNAKNVISVGAVSNNAEGVDTNAQRLIIFRYRLATSSEFASFAIWPITGTGLGSWQRQMITLRNRAPLLLASPDSACGDLVGNVNGSFILVDMAAGSCELDARLVRARNAGAAGVLLIKPDSGLASPDLSWPRRLSHLHAPVTRAQGLLIRGILANPAFTDKELVYLTSANISVGPSSVTDFSSYGPALDGRIKPDLIGAIVTSAQASGYIDDVTEDTCGTGTTVKQGTSMAVPMVSGHLAIVRQYFREGFYPAGWKGPESANFTPSGMLLRAVAVAGASSCQGALARSVGRVMGPPPDPYQGWGRMDLATSIPLPGLSPEGYRLQVADGGTIASYETITLRGIRATGAGPITAVLVWNDYPAAPQATTQLVNNLDLSYQLNGGAAVLAQRNATGGPDTINTVERAYLPRPAPRTDVAFVISADRLNSWVMSGPDAKLPQRWALAVVGHFTGTLQTYLNPAFRQPQRLPAFAAEERRTLSLTLGLYNPASVVLPSRDGRTPASCITVAPEGPIVAASGCDLLPPPAPLVFTVTEEGQPRTRIVAGALSLMGVLTASCVEAPPASSPGLPLSRNRCTDTDAQAFALEPTAGTEAGLYRIRSPSSGHCWTAGLRDGFVYHGAPLSLEPCADSDAQRFAFTEYSQGWWTAATQMSPDLCVDAGGMEMQLRACDVEEPDQRLRLRDVAAPGMPGNAGFSYVLRSASANRCLAVGDPRPGSQLIQAVCTATSASQRFAAFRNSLSPGAYFQLVPRSQLGSAVRPCLRAAADPASGQPLTGSLWHLAECDPADPRQFVELRPLSPPLRFRAEWEQEAELSSWNSNGDTVPNVDLVVTWSTRSGSVSTTYSISPISLTARGGKHGGDNALARPVPTSFEEIYWPYDDAIANPPDAAIYSVCLTLRVALSGGASVGLWSVHLEVFRSGNRVLDLTKAKLDLTGVLGFPFTAIPTSTEALAPSVTPLSPDASTPAPSPAPHVPTAAPAAAAACTAAVTPAAEQPAPASLPCAALAAASKPPPALPPAAPRPAPAAEVSAAPPLAALAATTPPTAALAAAALPRSPKS
ncbi:hypothetical protein HYH03_005110 [Edaphochlamys debaryana]|uniref:Ricin B lectin domain-containing protein n=1 Tax=Edaphochlamys debaryana TaxID=47281 RepID=A0A836C2H6_9CHLO|nr:hypothetical protein HYH03_005110 [Edaphochlamys debaryana]|eukprot:KAG2496693.1 hypothetical protein HYH03_005110 [Edaphochlamys debaryana]